MTASSTTSCCSMRSAKPAPHEPRSTRPPPSCAPGSEPADAPADEAPVPGEKPTVELDDLPALPGDGWTSSLRSNSRRGGLGRGVAVRPLLYCRRAGADTLRT